MVFDQIETLKRDYTDKYVVVDESRPELARFRGFVGQVKTVNMNGRALVEFQDYIANIAWYDIDLDFLKVVAKPEPAAVAKEAKPARKGAPEKATAGAAAQPAAAEAAAPKLATKQSAAAGEKKVSPIELARMQGAAKREGAAPVAKAKPAGEAAKPVAEPAKSAGKKPSTAEILAAARAKKSPPPETAAESSDNGESPAAPADKPVRAPVAAASTIETEPSSVTREKAIVVKEVPSGGWSKLATTAEKIAWCHTNDQGRNTR